MGSSEFDKEALRVSRGGSWSFTAVRARAAYRYGIFPGDRKNRLGFRLCRDLMCEPFRAATGVKQ
jgi:hypothetical protein